MRLYLAAWSVACLFALALAFVERKRLAIFSRDYFSALTQPWKLASFTVAAVGLTLAAPYTGDPTWDYTDALFMSLATFVTAPWVVAALYLAARRRLPLAQLYVALCLWLWSASWSYDLYIYCRDGFYPPTWLSNLFASSVLYLAGGLLWNLEWHTGRGVTFGFLEAGWPRVRERAPFRRVAWLALAIMILVALGFLPFFR